MMNAKRLRVFAWGLSALVVVLAFVAWGQAYHWRTASLSNYVLFPLFGLIAFSLMWSHYIAAVVRMYFKIEKAVLKDYFEATSLVVLAAILLHPGLLIWQLWRDGIGLPPGSYLSYVAPTMKLFVLMGTLSLFLFLAYELRRKYAKASWWQYVEYATDGAMILVFIHALTLGGQLQKGWFQLVWYFYGITLLGSLIYIYNEKLTPKKS